MRQNNIRLPKENLYSIVAQSKKCFLPPASASASLAEARLGCGETEDEQQKMRLVRQEETQL